MATVRLGGGDDTFRVTEKTSEFPDGSRVYGGNGDDVIAVGTGSPRGPAWRDLLLSGGNGEDELVLRIGFDSTLRGGRGDDALTVLGGGNRLLGGRGEDELDAELMSSDSVNHLFGGRGDDVLRSSSPPVVRPGGDDPVGGNVLTGGPGRDSFVLNTPSNFSNVRATNDDDGVASPGDLVIGNFNVITDYEAGEPISMGTSSAVGSPVEFDAAGHPLVPDGQHAVLLGRFSAQTEFTVDPCGDDLLIVFDDAASGGDMPAFQGSVVLLGVTDAGAVLIG